MWGPSPQPEIEATLPTVEAWSPNPRTAREVLVNPVSRTDLLEASFLLTLIEDLSVLSFSSLLLPSSFFSGLCVFSYSVMSDSLQAHGL